MRRLLDVLREDLGLTGTKEGCGEGECGACSVIVDGVVVDSCLVPVCQVEGSDVRTVEGLADAATRVLSPLQQAFLEAGGAQCGICTPGMLMAAQAYLEAGGDAEEDASARPSPATSAAARATRRSSTRSSWRLEHGRDSEAMTVEPPVVSPGIAGRGIRAHRRPAAIGPSPAAPTSWSSSRRTWPSRPRRILDLWRLDELRGIGYDGYEVSIGALTTFAELRHSPVIRARLPALAEAAATIGAIQIQNRATIGGNICNASPAGDSLPVLLAVDATFDAGLGGRRAQRLGAADFWTGYRQTALRPDELLLRMRFPVERYRHTRFRKVGTRRAQAISKVVMALSYREDGGVWRNVRLALGSVAATPIRAAQTEAVLEGGAPRESVADHAAAVLAEELQPIDDVRSTADYRRTVSARVLHRLLREEGGW